MRKAGLCAVSWRHSIAPHSMALSTGARSRASRAMSYMAYGVESNIEYGIATAPGEWMKTSGLGSQAASLPNLLTSPHSAATRLLSLLAQTATPLSFLGVPPRPPGSLRSSGPLLSNASAATRAQRARGSGGEPPEKKETGDESRLGHSYRPWGRVARWPTSPWQ